MIISGCDLLPLDDRSNWRCSDGLRTQHVLGENQTNRNGW
jgi:hypothetical protein